MLKLAEMILQKEKARIRILEVEEDATGQEVAVVVNEAWAEAAQAEEGCLTCLMSEVDVEEVDSRQKGPEITTKVQQSGQTLDLTREEGGTTEEEAEKDMAADTRMDEGVVQNTMPILTEASRRRRGELKLISSCIKLRWVTEASLDRDNQKSPSNCNIAVSMQTVMPPTTDKLVLQALARRVAAARNPNKRLVSPTYWTLRSPLPGLVLSTLVST